MNMLPAPTPELEAIRAKANALCEQEKNLRDQINALRRELTQLSRKRAVAVAQWNGALRLHKSKS